jgi:outer membrane protein OmpA-like peptidoglycan-associated protein
MHSTLYSVARRTLKSLAVPVTLALSACSHDAPPARTPAVVQPQPVEAPKPAPPSQEDTFKVSEVIREKCNLPETPTDSPQFDFDQSELRPRGMTILDGIASCVLEGALKGATVVVTGHTDPHGSDEYNRKLGMQRASVARDYLLTKGVPDGNLTVKSRGEADASGDTEADHQLDRRVEFDAIPL